MTKVIGVRFIANGKSYYFSPGDLELQQGDYVIVETARGTESVSYTHLDVYKRQRYSRLQRAFPERAQVLFDKAADAAKDRYEYLGKLAKLYE